MAIIRARIRGSAINRGAAQNYSKPDVNKAGRKQEIKCCICGKGHLTKVL